MRGRAARQPARPMTWRSRVRIPPLATRMWCSGSTPASQAGNRGFGPRHPLHPENQNNGSDPTMGLAAVLSMWTLPEKTWTNSLGMGTQRQGIRKHAIAPLAQRLEQGSFKPWVVGSNPTGGTMQSPVCEARVRVPGLEHKLKRPCGTHVRTIIQVAKAVEIATHDN